MSGEEKNIDIKDKETKRKKKFSHQKQLQLRIIIIVALIIGIYFVGFFYYNGKFLNHTTINNIDVSQLTMSKAHKTLQQKMIGHSVDLTFVDNEKETVKVDECGLSYNQNNHINDLFAKQNHWLWFVSFFDSYDYTLEDAVTVDQEKLNDCLSNLKHLNKDMQVAPVDAQVVYKDKDFTIEKEDNGSTIDVEKFKNVIITAFTNGQSEVNVFDEGGYVLPKVTAEDASLKSLLTAAKEHANASLTYETMNGKVTLDGNTIKDWLSINEQGQYYRDETTFKEKATEFVKKLSKKINNIGTTRTYTLANGRKVTVSGGNYGLKVNTEKEVEGLLADIKANKQGTRSAVTSGVQASLSNNGIGNTYAEVDLTKQHMYYVKNGSVVLESDCVTGTNTPSRKTPPGTYYVYFKQRNRVLRGTRNPDGTWPYETPVSYWMAFNKGIGFHDAYWRKTFGGQIYQNNGSHGCVNLPPKVAAQLYSLIKTNTPVVVHY